MWRKYVLTTRKKHRPMKDNAYRQDIVTRTSITRVELITISTVTIRSIWHNSAADFFLRFWKLPPQICESCGATYRQNHETFSALLSTSGPLTNSEKNRTNRCIIGDAILPQTGTKLTKNAVLNLALCCGAIWHHREKSQYRYTTTIHPVYNCSKRFWKIYFLQDFWCAQTCSFRAVFGLLLPILTLAVSARCGKFFLYRCTSAVPALNYCSRIFFKSLSYFFTKWCAQTFPQIFLDFRNFWRQFRENYGAT